MRDHFDMDFIATEINIIARGLLQNKIVLMRHLTLQIHARNAQRHENGGGRTSR